jgi:hypothetical protein
MKFSVFLNTSGHGAAKALPRKLENGNTLANGAKHLFLNLRSRCRRKAWGVSPRGGCVLRQEPARAGEKNL